MSEPLYRAQVLVCSGTGCNASGAETVRQLLAEELEKQGLTDEIEIVETGCRGFCEVGPIVVIYPDGTFYCRVQEKDLPFLVEETLLKGRVVERLLYQDPITARSLPHYSDIPFYGKQMRVILRNCGMIDPESIDEYIARDGYEALATVLSGMTPEEVLDEIKRAGLRGRGGGGFPTARKWETSRRVDDYPKFLLANGDEGDPGAFMNRSLMEGDPHSIIEGMVIAAYTIGSDRGYIYVRAEYPLAVKNLGHAIKQAEEYGLLGENIMGSGFTFNLKIKQGAGAFVCGESTALQYSIEGKRGMPRPRPPQSAVKGLFGKPTVLNNVETFANVPIIIRKGADWFASIGTENSKGTKTFALTGKVKNTGLVEVPMGITLRELIYDIGGGIVGDKAFKAAQAGGPSGGCVPRQHLDLPIDYESLQSVGAMMGSGGLVIMDEDTCMVDVARFFLNFSEDESCGKCSVCRLGTQRMREILERICAGEGRPEDIEVLGAIGSMMKNVTLCGLGQTAANPVLSTLRYFRDEYEAHIFEKRCPARVCPALISYHILADKCTGCTACARRCPVQAISGEKKELHVIDQDECIKCGACIATCRFDAIIKESEGEKEEEGLLVAVDQPMVMEEVS